MKIPFIGANREVYAMRFEKDLRTGKIRKYVLLSNNKVREELTTLEAAR